MASWPDLPVLRLKRHEERRLRRGHLWVFSNEVDTARTPLTAFRPGEPVRIVDWRGKPLGTGYVNPHSLICARLLSRDPRRLPDRALLRERLARALALRERLFPSPHYRLAYGEGDGLPGLVVDRYGEVLAVQLTTAGMERLREEVLAVLEELLRPRCVVLRGDTPLRGLEGLPREVTVALGEAPEEVEVLEEGARFRAALLGGQKTGWYYDHRLNRLRAMAYARGGRVLDLFAYVGGWGIQAARAGAREVLCVDGSAAALERARANAEANGVGERVRTREGDAFETLQALRQAGERFDLVILDPPAFIKRRRDQAQGEAAYHRLHRLALEVLAEGGVLVAASCSFHYSEEALRGSVLKASRRLGRGLQLLERGHQGPDHPVHPAIPETAYLKALFCRAWAEPGEVL